MKYRLSSFLIHAGILSGILNLVSCGSEQVKEDVRPNIVYILVDDLGYGDLNLGIKGCEVFRNPHIQTPNLARLASESLVFTNHYAASPVCSPSRAGLLTGRTPTRANINRWINDVKFDGPEYLRDQEITIAELCQDAGYATAIFGKWHLNCADWSLEENWKAGEGSFPNQQGFQYGMVSKENPHLTTWQNSNSQKNPGDFYSIQGKHMGTIKGYTSAILTDSALAYLEDRDPFRPFFLYLPYDAVHERIYNPDLYDEMYHTGDPNKDVYYANVTYLDNQIGRLLEGLKEMGLDENTLVFFSSDNGPEIMRAYYGAWRSYGTSWPLYGQKRMLYEGGIRVPGMIRWKGKIAHTVSEEPNSTVDVLPTICELLELPLPDREPDGVSMLSHILEGAPIKREKPLYWQYEFPECYMVEGEAYESHFNGEKPDRQTYLPSSSIREGNYVLRGISRGRYQAPEEFRLYDVVNDPNEQQELSLIEPELVDSLILQLLSMYQSVNEDRIAILKQFENEKKD
jgi:arylsulfatase A